MELIDNLKNTMEEVKERIQSTNTILDHGIPLITNINDKDKERIEQLIDDETYYYNDKLKKIQNKKELVSSLIEAINLNTGTRDIINKCLGALADVSLLRFIEKYPPIGNMES
jgi:hypothetical protein